MPSPAPDTRTLSIARILVLAIAAFSIILFLWVAIERMAYPYELEWLEGTMVDHVLRVLRGQPIYVAPTPAFVPFIYPPLFYYLGAAVSLITGPGLLPLRILAFASTLGCFAMVGGIVKRESGSAFMGFVAAAFYAAAFEPGGKWFDLARLDSTFILFILIALALLRFYGGIASAMVAGFVMAAALLTKQSALILALPFAVYLLLFERTRAVAFVTAFAVPSIAAYLILNALSDGWYQWYVYSAPSRHTYIWQQFYAFWAWGFFRIYPIAAIAIVWYFLSWKRGERLHGNRELVYYGLFFFAMLGSSWLHRVHKGGFENVLLLLYVAVAVVAGIALAQLFRKLSDQPRLAVVILFAVAIQLLALNFDPWNHVPGGEQRRAWAAIIDRIRAAEGPVWLPAHGYIAELGGKRSGAHIEAMFGSVEHAANPRVSEPMRRLFVQALDSSRYALIITDRSTEEFAASIGFNWLLDALHRNYVVADTVEGSDDALILFTGAETRPELVWVPRSR